MSSGRTSKYLYSSDFQERWKTAIYLRLSREDGDKLESDSIANQRKLIDRFLERNSDLEIYDYYIDDGYSGTNFNRPSMQRLLDDIKTRKVTCLIVKDLSRFGRNYHETGRYLEVVFPLLRLRFISVNDNIDSFKNPNSLRNSTVSFKNVMNDEYARDISNKVRSSFNAKRKRGEYIGSFALYGYIKDPNDRHKLIIDEEAANNVRYIYQLFLSGVSIYNISIKLKELGILPPKEYKKRKGMDVNSTRFFNDEISGWSTQTIRRMLQNEMYIGNMVQGTYQHISYKVRKLVRNPKEQYIVKEGTHEPIIDKETFYSVQERFQHDTWQPKGSTAGEYNVETGSIYVGYIKCADCGRAMQRSGYFEGKNNFYYFVCGAYLNWKQCSRHAFRINKLNDIVLSVIQKQVALAIEIDNFIQSQRDAEPSLVIEHLKRELKSAEAERTTIVKFQNDLYIDLKSNIISQDQYFHFKNEYAEKLNQVEERMKAIEEEIPKSSLDAGESHSFLETFKKYSNITELSRDVIVELIDCILVHKNKELTIRFKFEDEFKKVLAIRAEQRNSQFNNVEIVQEFPKISAN